MDFDHSLLEDATAAPLSPKIRRTPTLAIVIPVFKHSVLATEAIAAPYVRRGRPMVVVIVNDGCAYPETHEVCSPSPPPSQSW